MGLLIPGSWVRAPRWAKHFYMCAQKVLYTTTVVATARNGYAQLLAQYQVRGYSSVAEHSTADREVTGSTPVVPLEFLNYLFSLKMTKGGFGAPPQHP